MKRRLGLAIAIALLLGCQAQPGPTGVKPKTTTTKTKASPGASESPSASPAIVGGTASPIPLSEPQRIVGTGTQAVELIGKVKLISDKGLGIISNNTGSLVSNNGSNVVSAGGSNLIGKTKYGVQQAGGTSAVPEALLAEAQIEVLDAAGNVLVNADKQPITATTDASGNYSLKTNLPAENLILRVRLYQGGQLFAFITKDTATDTVDLDTASSLGAAYVMDKYVKKSQNVLNKLPGLEADKLQADMEAARVHMAEAVPSYKPQELVSTAEQLRTKATALDDTIKRIEAILLAGQANLGNGLPATQVSLSAPSGVAVDADGNVYVTEGSVGRIRMVTKDGTIYTVAGTGAQAPRDGSMGIIRALALGADGTLYTIKRLANQAIKLPPNAAPALLAGNGQLGQGALGKATEMALHKPDKLVLTADGTVYISESGTINKNLPARILVIKPDGTTSAVPMPEGRWNPAEIDGLAVGADGTIWVAAKDLAGAAADKEFLARLKPGGSWEFVVEGLLQDSNIEMTVGPDGMLYVSYQTQSKIMKYDATGQATLFAGIGRPGYGGDGGPATAAMLNFPRGMTFKSDGTMVLADEGSGLVRTIGKDGIIKTIAGATGLTQVGDALAVAINQPMGLTMDAQGRLIVSEAASNTIKRLDGNQLTLIAGTVGGFGGDGGPATSASMLRPNGVAFYNNELYLLDGKNNRLRKIDATGMITTIAGSGSGGPQGGDKIPALQANMDSATGLAISPDGIPYWTDNTGHVILRLKDGFVERVAGAIGSVKGNTGDGGPAIDAKLSGPSGLTFDKAGNLYVADSGNLRVRKIDTAGIITTVAGLDKPGMLALLGTGKAGEQNGELGTKSALWGPFGLQVDDAGNLYIGEAGTLSATAFGDGGEGNVLGFDTSLMPAELLPKTYARIRKLKTDGTLVNVTGPGTSLLSDTAGDNMLALPTNILLDSQGRLVIGDSGLNQLKVLPKGSF